MADESLTENLGRKTTIGAAWTVAMRFFIRIIGLVSTVILARILAPDDFGVVAMAMLVIGFIDAISEMSLEVALIKNQDATRSHYDSVWTMSIIRGAVIGAVIFAASGPVAAFLEEPRLVEVLRWLALGPVIIGFTNVGIVDFQKKLQFDADFRFMVSVKLCSFIATIVAAVILQTYWALIIGMTVQRCARVAMSYIVHPYRPRLDLSRWLEIFRFTRWLLGHNVIQFFQNRSDTAIISKLFGASSVGIYSVAYEFATMATSEMVMPIRRAMLPAYSLLQDDPQRFKSAFIEGYALIFIIAAPVALGVGLTAGLFVPIVLGPKWLETVPLIEILALNGLFQTGTANTALVLITAGKPRYLMFAMLGCVLVGVPAMLFAGQTWGMVGVAWSTVGMMFLSMLSLTVLSCRVSGTGVIEFCSAMWRGALALLAMIAVVLVVRELLPEGAQILQLAWSLAIVAASGAATYVLALLGLWGLSGRPQGAEQRLVGYGLAATRRLSRSGGQPKLSA